MSSAGSGKLQEGFGMFDESDKVSAYVKQKNIGMKIDYSGKARRVLKESETQNVADYARGKLAKKNLDFIVANNVAEKDAGFGVPTNHVQIFYADGRAEDHPLMPKAELAGVILDRLEEAFQKRG